MLKVVVPVAVEFVLRPSAVVRSRIVRVPYCSPFALGVMAVGNVGLIQNYHLCDPRREL